MQGMQWGMKLNSYKTIVQFDEMISHKVQNQYISSFQGIPLIFK